MFAMIGFSQKWNIEVERTVSGSGGAAPSGPPRRRATG